MGRRAVIVGACPSPGAEAFYARLLADAEFVIAADAGAALATSLGRAPDLVVGDFDSSVEGAAESLRESGVEVEVHPAFKDATDLDLAVAAARTRGFGRITFTAAFSARIDHTLAAIGSAMRASDLISDIQEADFSAWVVGGARRQLVLRGQVGSVVSLVAPAGASGVTLLGFGYPLSDARLGEMSSLGISNVLVAATGTVSVADGSVIVIAPIDRVHQRVIEAP